MVAGGFYNRVCRFLDALSFVANRSLKYLCTGQSILDEPKIWLSSDKTTSTIETSRDKRSPMGQYRALLAQSLVKLAGEESENFK